jgi:BASS family bile acid:Na+ symporter
MTVATIIGLVIQVSIFLTVLGFGLQASLPDATFLFRHPALLLRAVFSMNVIMCLFAGVLVAIFSFHPAIEIVLVALAVSPVPPILPNKAFNAGGRREYTLGLLNAISLLSIVTVPLALWLFGQAFQRTGRFDSTMVVKTILVGVIAPLLLGILIHHFAPAFGERVGGTVVKVGLALVVLAFLPILLSSLPTVWSLFGNGTILAITAFAAVGLAVGHWLGGPDPHDRITLAISTASRHPGIAMAIATANIANPKEGTAGVMLYLLISVVLGAVYLKLAARGVADSAPVAAVKT